MKKTLSFIFLLLLVVGAGVAFYGYKQVFGSYVTQNVSLKIPSESSYDELIKKLEEKNLIKNKQVFDLLSNKMNLKNNVHGGYYELKKGTSLFETIRILRGGLQTPVLFTLNNVNFKTDLAAKISNQLEIDSTAVMAFLNNDTLLNKMGYDTDDILTLFIPNTYEMYWNTSFSSFIDKMQKEHDAFWNENRIAKATNKGLTPKKAYILASIVEKEYKHAEERERIAGVYINRIKKGMKLQADPTVKFALNNLALKRILTVHTEYDNPYNTYFYTDLPPGPICLPETSTIEAVLNAENHNYLYFCAKADLSGYHEFNTNYAAHLNAARLYQAALNKLNIYE